MTLYSQKTSHLLQEADDELNDKWMLLSTDGLGATQFPVILGYLYVSIYLKKSQGNPSILNEMDNLTGADISHKVTKAVS